MATTSQPSVLTTSTPNDVSTLYAPAAVSTVAPAATTATPNTDPNATTTAGQTGDAGTGYGLETNQVTKNGTTTYVPDAGQYMSDDQRYNTTNPDGTTDPSLARSVANLQDYTDQQVYDPTLPANATMNPVLQQAQDNELLQNNYQVDPNGITAGRIDSTAATANSQAPIDATQTTASQAQASQSDLINPITAQTYNATQVNTNDPVFDLQGATDTFDDSELVQGQLQKILGTVDPSTGYPAWASQSVRKVSQQLAARGMDSSSMAGQAMMTALVEAALPIAQADAQSLQGIKLQNLANTQQAQLVKYQAQTQQLLSNQSADNAAKQFNATSQNQVNEFMGTLAQQNNDNNANRAQAINTLNAQLQQATSQFNAQEADQVKEYVYGQNQDLSKFNAEQINAITTMQDQLNATLMKADADMANQREQFNVNNSLVVDQSNAQWRRDLNTQNTEMENYANMTNAQNALSISNTAYNNLWQEFRDEASWSVTTAENAKDRATQLEMLSRQLDQKVSASTQKANSDFLGSIGSFAFDLLGSTSPTTSTTTTSKT